MVRFTSMVSAAVLAATLSGTSSFAAKANDPQRCAETFHRLLREAPQTAFRRIDAVREAETPVETRLPGHLVLSPSPSGRDASERKALRVAERIANQRGRSPWRSSANDRWIVDRTIHDLTEFMSQDVSPYLCGGVENYAATLRTYLDRVSVTGGSDLPDLLDVQARRTRETIRNVLASLAPVPLPHYAPDRRPIAVLEPARGLVPALELRRGTEPDLPDRLMRLSASQPAEPEAYGPYLDPGLPLKRTNDIPLAEDADRLAAIDLVLKTAIDGGFLAAGGSNLVFEQRTEGYRPVLDRLADLKPILDGKTGAKIDSIARRDIEHALSDIELLDYLSHAAVGAGDPLLAAIEATLDAILDARGSALAAAAQ